jgi:hypothetical protein
MRSRTRRLGAVLAAAVAALAIAASPAFAHFCSKTGWSDAALEHAAKSGPWLTAAEWNGFIDEVAGAGEICPAGAANLKAQIAAYPSNTLFMGPGLLAGGTLKNGKGNTPSQFNYLHFEDAFGLCAA